LILDNFGMCRFHRKWAEEMIPEIVESLFGLKLNFLQSNAMTASRINSRNSSVFWESERSMDFVHAFLERQKTVNNIQNPELDKWIDLFRKDKKEAALSYWYEIHKGIQESLREF
jgi:glyceraldehyde-3-phosphate dehydrogenase (ferredoxin)